MVRLKIREYLDNDLEDVVRIYNESFKNLSSCYPNPMSFKWFMGKFGPLLQSKKGNIFTAESNNELVGYIFVYSEKRPQDGLVAYIPSICIVPHVQRQGIGSKLMDRAIQWAKNQGAVLVENDEEIVENPGAINFFKKLGFEVFHRGAYMSKDLTLPDRFIPPETYQIRERRLEDIDDLLRIRKEAFKEFGPWYNTNEAGFKQRMMSRIKRNDVKVFMAFKNRQPVGYVTCQIKADNGASIRNISVLPDWRNKSVGSALMARAFNFLRKNRVQRLGTGTETAEGFYKKLGFKVEKRYVRVRKYIN